jgi:hypothetical protein
MGLPYQSEVSTPPMHVHYRNQEFLSLVMGWGGRGVKSGDSVPQKNKNGFWFFNKVIAVQLNGVLPFSRFSDLHGPKVWPHGGKNVVPR